MLSQILRILKTKVIYVANLDTATDMHVKINDEISVDLKYLGYSDSLTQAATIVCGNPR